MDIMSTDEFEPRIVQEVEHLLGLLDEMERHPALKGKLALHGGTAINLFMLNVPRLSVGIDVSYIGCVSRDGMIADRPRIEEGIENVDRALDYAVETHPGGHAGHTFLLRYRGDWNVDRVKARDLYDVSNLRNVYKSLEPGEQERAHRLALYYASLSAYFPKPFEGREWRFTDRSSELADQLYPMLHSSSEHPALDVLMEDAERFIAE